MVDLLVQAAGQLECVSAIERVDVPDFGQHLVIRAFQTAEATQDKSCWWAIQTLCTRAVR